MNTIIVPDDLFSKLRAAARHEGTEPNELVVRVLRRYLSRCGHEERETAQDRTVSAEGDVIEHFRNMDLSDEKREEMIRAAEELEAELARAGITEEELIEHFHAWRRREMAGRVREVREALAKAGVSLTEEEVVKRVHEWRSQSGSGH